MNVRKFLVLSLLCVLFTACSSTAKVSEKPPKLSVEINPRWQDNDAAVLEWAALMDEPVLADLIEEALHNNYDLQAAAARWQASRLQAEVIAGERLPELGLDVNAGHQYQNGSGSDQASAQLVVSWELDVWGRISSAQAAALLSAEEQQQLFRYAQLSLAAQVAKTWLDALEAKVQWQLLLHREKTLQQSLSIIEDGFASGIRAALDVYSARAELVGGQAASFQQEQMYSTALRNLALLLGRYPDAKMELPQQLPELLVQIPDDLSSALLERRPDVIAAAKNVASQQASVSEAGAARLPRFTLTAAYGGKSDSLSNVLSGEQLAWNVLGGITAPIFNGGALKAQEQQQQILLKATIGDYRQTALKALTEVEQGLDNDRLLQQQLTSARLASDYSRQAEDQAFESYIAGLENLNTWLQSQRSAYDRSAASLNLQNEHLKNRIDLHLALGGDFGLTGVVENDAE